MSLIHLFVQSLFRPVPLLGVSTVAASILVLSQHAISIRRSTPQHSGFSSAAMSSSSAHPWSVTSYIPRHTSWPYSAQDFTRRDETNDAEFYRPPRFVTHIDDHAISVLKKYYDTVLPKEGRILDFCSSWVSHYPRSVETAVEEGRLQVVGMGMNKLELDRNAVLNGGRILRDLNDDAEIRGQDLGAQHVDAATCAVSIDYLMKPREVLESLRRRTKQGGTVHLIISNRCFPTKASRRWLEVGEDERLQMVGDYLHFSGWRNIEIIELCDRWSERGVSPREQQQPRSHMPSWIGHIGMTEHDPLWVVRASNIQEA